MDTAESAYEAQIYIRFRDFGSESFLTVSQGIQYLATVTERGGKVYAFFVKSPTKVCPKSYRNNIQEACKGCCLPKFYI